MKKNISRLLTIISFCLLAIHITACGNEKDKDKMPSAPEYTYHGKSEEIHEEVHGDIKEFELFNGKVYFFSELVLDKETGESEYSLNYSNVDGSEYHSVPFAKGTIFLSPLRFSADGKGYYIEVSSAENRRSYLLKTISETGMELSSVDITETVEDKFPDLYPSRIAICKDFIYIADYTGILALKIDGSYAGAITDVYGLHSLIQNNREEIYAYLWGDSGYHLCGIDLSAGTLEESIKIPFDGYNNLLISGGDSSYDFFVSDGTSLFGYNINEEKTELLNWTQTGTSMMEVSNIFYAGEETFVCAGKSFPYGYPKISVLTKQLPENTDKIELVLAGNEYSITPLLENSVVKFNATNDKYFITIKKYPFDNRNQLNLDIISGNIPDILMSNSYVPIDTYISKGIFTDLYELIDSDPNLDRSDFVPNLLTACETDGKLYHFTSSFKIYTVIGKTSIFGTDKGITIDRLNKIAAQKPVGTEVLPASTKTDILRFAMEISGREFIDFQKKECSFDSDQFIKILEYANTYISEQDYETYFDDAFWGKFDTMYADENALLMLAYLSDYADIYRFEQVNFGEAVTAVGFPCENGNGTSFLIDSGFSISANSKKKEGAWEFVKTLLLPEYQDSCEDFPVRKDSLEKKANAAMKPDPDRVNYAVVLMGQMALTAGAGDIGEPTQADIDRINEVINSANGLMQYDENIMNIILEEAASYFNSKKSSRDTAALIQTRVSLYLEEQK